MAQTDHPIFLQPHDPTERVWRYMDLAKYISFLRKRELYLSRLDRLGDPFEGTISPATLGDVVAQSAALFQAGQTPEEGHYTSQLRDAFRMLRTEIYASCWHLNDTESEAMWRLYAPHGLGVVVSTTYNELANGTPADLFIGLVQYIDFAKDRVIINNIYGPAITKRRSFAHEREVRLLKFQWEPPNERPAGLSIPASDSVNYQVITHPYAPDWYHDVVVDVTSRYSTNMLVSNSALRAPPLL